MTGSAAASEMVLEACVGADVGGASVGDDVGAFVVDGVRGGVGYSIGVGRHFHQHLSRASKNHTAHSDWGGPAGLATAAL